MMCVSLKSLLERKDDLVIKERPKVMLTTGNYINLWNLADTYDVFIILNEANDTPTIDEIDKIEELVRPIFEDDEGRKKARAKKVLEENEEKLHCLEYGCQVIVNK